MWGAGLHSSWPAIPEEALDMVKPLAHSIVIVLALKPNWRYINKTPNSVRPSVLTFNLLVRPFVILLLLCFRLYCT